MAPGIEKGVLTSADRIALAAVTGLSSTGPAQVVVKPGLGSAERILPRMSGSLMVTLAGPLARGPKTRRAPGNRRVPPAAEPRAELPRAVSWPSSICVEPA